MKVFKFGGGCVENAATVKRIPIILRKFPDDKVVIVVSAMGKMTNALEHVVEAFFHNSRHKQKRVEKVNMYYDRIANVLFPHGSYRIRRELKSIFMELIKITNGKPSQNYSYEYDRIVSLGEIASSKIISAYLSKAGIKNVWLDARHLIRTDDTYRQGKVDLEMTGKLARKKVLPCFTSSCRAVVIQGFIGGTAQKTATTLGREASDYSAAILALATDAESVTLWKDVPGIFTRDPKEYPNAIKLDQLSYGEALNLVTLGSKVIHPKTLEVLMSNGSGIPLHVRSFFKFEEKGTVVSN